MKMQHHFDDSKKSHLTQFARYNKPKTSLKHYRYLLSQSVYFWISHHNFDINLISQVYPVRVDHIKTPYTFLVKSIIKFKILWFYKDICIYKPNTFYILNETHARSSVMRVRCALHNLILDDTG